MIEVRGLTKRYGDTTAVDGLSFRIEPGRITGFLVSRASPLAVAGAVLTGVGALVALRAVWGWERTHVVVTTEKLFVVRGTLRRRAAAVRLDRVGGVEIEQTLLGRILGYGTLIAGPLHVDHVPAPRRVYQLVEHLLV